MPAPDALPVYRSRFVVRLRRYVPAALFAATVVAFGLPGNRVDAARPLASTTLVVNEIDYHQPGTGDLAEFVEVRNIGTGPVDLADYDVVGVDGQGVIYRRDALATASFNLASGARYVVCGNSTQVPNCQRSLGAADVWRGGSGTAAFAIAIVKRGRADVVVDSVAYEGRMSSGPNGEPWPEGLWVTPGDNATDANFGIGRYNPLNGQDGGDTDQNRVDVTTRCITPGQANSAAQPPCQPTPTPSPTATRPPTSTLTPSTTPSPTVAPPTRTPTTAPPDVLVFVVDSELNRGDGRPGDKLCDAGGICTLRAALQETNASAHVGPIVIRFAKAMEIQVPMADALPPLVRGNVTLTGVNPGVKSAAFGPQAGPQQLPQVWIQGPGGNTQLVGLELNDTSGVAVQGLAVSGFAVGVLVHGGGSGNTVGVLSDGDGDELEGNRIFANTDADVRVAQADNTVVAGNQIGHGPLGGAPAAEVGVDLAEGATLTLVGRQVTALGARGAPNRIQWRHHYGVRVMGKRTEGNLIAGNVLGGERDGEDVDVGNAVGVLLAGEATRNIVGNDGEMPEDKSEANQIAFNLEDGIQVGPLAVGNIISGNAIHHNRQHGIRLMRTAGGGTWMTRNNISGNGGAAIAYAGEGYEPPVPVIDSATQVTAERWRVQGRACPKCVVELFADPANEALFYLEQVSADDGTWSLVVSGKLGDVAVNLTATARTEAQATSRLSAARQVDGTVEWFLHAVPPNGPRAIGLGRNLARRYRLWNDKRLPEPKAEVRFTPLDLRTFTDENGFLEVVVPLSVAAEVFNRSISFTVEAVSNVDGQVHPVGWHPVMAMARERPKDETGILLDLSGLGDSGVGAVLRRGSANTGLRTGDTLVPPRVAVPRHALGAEPAACAALAGPAQGEAGAVGVAWTAAAVATFREGEFAWQENMPRGGGLYELEPGATALEGELSIQAPLSAWNTSGPASNCNPPGSGAVICSWDRDKGCWVPRGSTVIPPASGASTFTAKTEVSIPPPGSMLLTSIQASKAYTLYTVGFDVTPPVITPTMASGAVLSALPPVLADAADTYSGVDAVDGVSVRLGGQLLTVAYDIVTRRILVPEGSRALPPGLQGPTDLVIRVTDGFCNLAEKVVSVQLEPGVAPTNTPMPTLSPTPTGTPQASATSTATATTTGTLPGGTTPTPATATPTGGPDPRPWKVYAPFTQQTRR